MPSDYRTLISDLRTFGLQNILTEIDREPRTFIHVKRAKRFDPVG